MTFAYPWLLAAAAALPPLVLLCHVLTTRAGRKKLDGVVAPRLRQQLLQSVSFARRRWKAVLTAAALGLVALAAARPQWGRQEVEVERSSVDFFIALDLSRSMLAEDVTAEGGKVSRLAAAKSSLTKFLDSLAADRAGLIIFAGDAFLASPVTEDHEALKRNLAALTHQSIARQGSDIAKAIRLALANFSSGKHEGKAVVVITDGEELQGEALLAAREAAQAGVAVFTAGAGTAAGGRIPDRERGAESFVKNEFGREVMTRLNERMLRQLAAGARGFYEPLGPEGAGLEAIHGRGLKPLAKGTQTRASKDPREYFQWPLGLALALLLGEMLLSDRRRPSRSALPANQNCPPA